LCLVDRKLIESQVVTRNDSPSGRRRFALQKPGEGWATR
jgi:hypothetical protein